MLWKQREKNMLLILHPKDYSRYKVVKFEVVWTCKV